MAIRPVQRFGLGPVLSLVMLVAQGGVPRDSGHFFDRTLEYALALADLAQVVRAVAAEQHLGVLCRVGGRGDRAARAGLPALIHVSK